MMSKRFKLLDVTTKEIISILNKEKSVPKTCEKLGISRWAFYREIKKRGYAIVPSLAKECVSITHIN